MRGILKRVFTAEGEEPPTGFHAPLSVERPCYYIGDIHGNEKALKNLLRALETDAGRPERVELVLLGDYVDRGDNSRDVLEWLFEISCAAPGSVTMLKGNHERMLLDFLDDPAANGPFWLANGGLQTLASFGIGGLTENSGERLLVQAADTLAIALTPRVIDWLRKLPTIHRNGNLAAVHAGADPALPLELQSERTLTWGHSDFSRVARGDGQWIIHGHTTHVHPQVTDGRIAIDTGAYHSGVLTAAFVEPDAPVRFVDSRAGATD